MLEEALEESCCLARQPNYDMCMLCAGAAILPAASVPGVICVCCVPLCWSKTYDNEVCASLQVLRKARIVGMTTSGVAIMQKLITALQPKVLVVEEAGELFEANLLACLGPQTEHIILIGERLRLRYRKW